MKFLIQKENDYFDYDFCEGLFKSIEYQNWLLDGMDGIKYTENYINYSFGKLNYIKTSYSKDCIPCGSVEFVTAYMEQIGLPIPNPRNVPKTLFKYAGRKIFNIDQSKIKFHVKDNYFCKSNNTIKGECGMISEIKQFLDTDFQLSSIVDMISEYRCFIYKHELVGIQNYQGDFTIFPNVPKVKSMIKDFTDQPIAYTLDVFIDNNLDTWCLEVHDFFSCGLYGFRDYRILPFMFSNWWNEYKKRSK